MLQILQESGAIPGQAQDWEKIVEAAENSGGFALGGKLADANHGAGIWIFATNGPGPRDHGRFLSILSAKK